MSRCPKCKLPYGRNGKRQKTKHHIVPQRLWRLRDLPFGIREMLDANIFELCRGCHDDLNHAIDMAEREILYVEHQRMYVETLTSFLMGGSHEVPDADAERGNGRVPVTRSGIRAARAAVHAR